MNCELSFSQVDHRRAVRFERQCAESVIGKCLLSLEQLLNPQQTN